MPAWRSLFGGLALVSCVALAAPDDHEPHPLTVSQNITLNDALAAAADRFGNAEARLASDLEAQRYAERAALPFAQPPSVILRHNRDMPGEDLGLSELEAQLQLMLKWPGQTDAQQAFAKAAERLSVMDEQARLLAIAGRVREAVWTHRIRRVELAAAEQALELAKELGESVALRSKLGDLASSEALFAKSETLAAERRVADAERMLADAERVYVALTGLSLVPADVDETMLPEPAMHPALAAADGEVDRARTNVDAQRMAARQPPQLTIGPRRERGVSADPYADSIGVMLQLPFGTRRYAEASTAQAERGVTEAELTRQRLYQALELARHEAEHELRALREMQPNIDDWLGVATEREAIAKLAFEAGETGLFDYLRVRTDANAARAAQAAQEARLGRALARVNQAAGAMPAAFAVETETELP